MLGRWWKAGTQFAKLVIVRLVFILSLLILLPLAVLNRQSVGIFVNPMDLIRAEPSGRIFVPLFIALFVIFILGLMVGWVMGRFGGAKKPVQNTTHTMPRAAGMVKAAHNSSQGDTPASRAAPKTALGAPAETESDETHER